MAFLIGFTGPPQSGKDTACVHLVTDHDYEKFSFADPIREALLALDPWADSFLRVSEIVNRWGWDVAKTRWPEIRRLLQQLGCESGRTIHGENVWVDLTMAKITSKLKEGKNVCVADVRFKNEVMAINRWGGIIVKVRRDVQTNPEILQHRSEVESKEIIPDISIHNHTDIADFQRRLDRTVNRIHRMRRKTLVK